MPFIKNVVAYKYSPSLRQMGNSCWSVFRGERQKSRVVDCIQQMQKVEKTLSLLIDKYEKQIKEQKQKARQKLYKSDDCKRHVKTIMIIKHHKKKLEDRLNACQNKRYHLESLNVTKMHIDAVKMTSTAFSQFLKDNDIERVEQLTESLTEMIDDACEINDTLTQSEGPFTVDDADIEEEYRQMQLEIQLPVVPTGPHNWSQLELVDLGSSGDEQEDGNIPLMTT